MADNSESKSLSTKGWLIVAGVILLIILFIGIMIFRAGRKKGSINVSAPIRDNPNDPSGNNNPQTSTADLEALAQDIHSDMSGVNLYHDTALYAKRVLTLSDTDFARLYSIYNQKYQKESGQTLSQWVDSEAVYDSYIGLGGLIGTQWGSIKTTLMDRFARLNLI